MKFIVDRRTWYRGHGFNGTSKLLRFDDTRCCIGFVAQQCGIADDEIQNVCDVLSHMEMYENDAVLWPEWLLNIEVAAEAYAANDCQILNDTQREARLKQIFADNGDEIEFVN